MEKRLNSIKNEIQRRDCSIIFNKKQDQFQIWNNNERLFKVSVRINEISKVYIHSVFY